MGYTYLGYNLNRFMFKDKRVRQALSYAIDKQEIIDGVLFGLGRVCTGPYKPDTFWYNPNVRRYSYDPERAGRLLDEAGWKDTDGDGIRDKDGQPFSFTILTNQGNEMRKKAGQIIQQHLSKVGIKVSLRIIEWAAFISQFIDKRNFDATLLGWISGPDPNLINVWHSSKTREGELNFIGFKNEEADRMLEMESRHLIDGRERNIMIDFKRFSQRSSLIPSCSLLTICPLSTHGFRMSSRLQRASCIILSIGMCPRDCSGIPCSSEGI